MISNELKEKTVKHAVLTLVKQEINWYNQGCVNHVGSMKQLCLEQQMGQLMKVGAVKDQHVCQGKRSVMKVYVSNVILMKDNRSLTHVAQIHAQRDRYYSQEVNVILVQITRSSPKMKECVRIQFAQIEISFKLMDNANNVQIMRLQMMIR